MRWCVLLLGGSLAVACGGGGEEVAETADTLDFDPEDTVLTVQDTVLPPMPDYPGQRGGYLVAHAVGATDFELAWPARAGRCSEPAMLLVIAELERSGASVLLELPDGDALVEYPVKLATDSGAPEPPAAQLGFQFFEDVPSAYQAAEGTVEVYGIASGVSGRFAITIRHIVNQELARVAGVFHNVDIEDLPPDWCDRARAARDSLAAGTP